MAGYRQIQGLQTTASHATRGLDLNDLPKSHFSTSGAVVGSVITTRQHRIDSMTERVDAGGSKNIEWVKTEFQTTLRQPGISRHAGSLSIQHPLPTRACDVLTKTQQLYISTRLIFQARPTWLEDLEATKPYSCENLLVVSGMTAGRCLVPHQLIGKGLPPKLLQ